MYNWVPQADTISQANTVAIPEAPANNPLMTLPRYFDVNARGQLDTVRQISEGAALYAEQNKPIELDYYNIVCAPLMGPVPGMPLPIAFTMCLTGIAASASTQYRLQ